MTRRPGRSILAAAVLAATGCCGEAAPPGWTLTPVTAVDQFGVVGNRDPLGAISPDGRWLATSIQHVLQIVPTSGGVVRELPTGGRTIQQLVWLPDGSALLTAEADTAIRWWRNGLDGARRPWWPAGTSFSAGGRSVAPNEIRQVALAPDGKSLAGLTPRPGTSELWILSTTGGAAQASPLPGPASFPAISARGEIACLIDTTGTPSLSLPCGKASAVTRPAYGPLAFSPSGDTIYFATPNDRGVLDLWLLDRRIGRDERLAGFARDTYAPSVARDGRVIFKAPNYRTHVVVADSLGQSPRQLTAFQAETSSWDPTGKWIGITYGTWRRFIDDYHYPDIAQDAGIIAADSGELLAAPHRIVDSSMSEDQSMGWSPNERWIAYHSHKEQSDDIWLRPADLSAPGKRITQLGRGMEAGWPRWSPDGRWIIFGAESKRIRRPVIYLVGASQETGATEPEREIPIEAPYQLLHAEWLPDNKRIVVHGFEPPEHHRLAVVSIAGGRPRIIHEYRHRQRFTGLGVSADGRWVVFPAMANDGFLQIFRIPVAGGTPEQLTRDPSHKTQPALSPTGRLAYTVWSYRTQFWMLAP